MAVTATHRLTRESAHNGLRDGQADRDNHEERNRTDRQRGKVGPPSPIDGEVVFGGVPCRRHLRIIAHRRAAREQPSPARVDDVTDRVEWRVREWRN